uniref:Uncharacterized protein n=1 Tax=Cyprinus carpio TaxID=7962 RepID=A0A8C1LTK8_CYPCA
MLFHQTELYAEVPATCLPIVYSPEYNITFMGLEKLHPFDAGKWGKVIRFLKEEQFITDEIIVLAREASEADLLVVHTARYLNRLKVEMQCLFLCTTSMLSCFTAYCPFLLYQIQLFLPWCSGFRTDMLLLKSDTGMLPIELAVMKITINQKIDIFTHL